MSKKLSGIKIIILLYSLLFFMSCDNIGVKNIYMPETNFLMTVGQKDTVELFFEPIEATNYALLTWHSSDPSVAIVDQMGVLTAVYTGECTITASYRDFEAKAQVRVLPVDFSMGFSKAIVYYYGDYSGQGVNTYILRLLSDGYEISPNGDISGAGYYFNINMYLPLSNDSTMVGDFLPSVTPKPYRYKQGIISEKNGAYYASGTFLGLTSINSSKVILVENGVLTVDKIGEQYSVSGNLVGNKQEDIGVEYTGNILVFDKTNQQTDTICLDGNNPQIESLGDIYSLGKKIFKIEILGDEDNHLFLELIAPLSAMNMPTGTYLLGNNVGEFSIMRTNEQKTNGSYWVNSANERFAIHYGSVSVSANANSSSFVFQILLIDENGKILSSCDN